MRDTINRFRDFHATINAKFNNLGALDPARDGVFLAVPRGRLAAQMLKVAQATGATDPDQILDSLRQIYRAVEGEIAGGLSGDCRDSLVDALVAEVEA
jgi:hypothetical protein